MVATTFRDIIGTKHLIVPNDAHFTTPYLYTLPNYDPGTRMLANAYAYYDDPAGFYSIPWGVSDWTLEVWLRKNANYGLGDEFLQIGLFNSAQSASEWGLVGDPWSNPWGFGVGFVSGSMNKAFTPANSSWHHLVFLLNSSVGASGNKTLRLYMDGAINGADVTHNTAATGYTASGRKLAFVGLNGTTNPNWGMAHLAIYNRLLTPTEISEHYAAGITAPIVV